MSDGGYTLVEMLAAMAILSLAIGGIAESAHVISLLQRAAARSVRQGQSLAYAQRRFQRLFEGQGPFRSFDAAGLVGSDEQLSFPCGTPRPCRARLANSPDGAVLTLETPGGPSAVPLAGLRDVHFRYGDTDGGRGTWPPGDRAARTLTSISVVTRSTSVPVLAAKVWREQSVDCAFDLIMADCREAGS